MLTHPIFGVVGTKEIKVNEQIIAKLGYSPAKQLPSGEWAGVMDMLFTVGLFVGIDMVGWRTRYCFPNRAAAEAALKAWDGEGFPPGYWIKQKPEDISNPNL